MKLSSFIRQLSRGSFCLLLCAALLFGCKRDEAKVYQIPKEASPPSQPASEETAQPEMGSPPPATTMSLPRFKYQLPEGWQEKPPSEMRIASFTVLGSNGQSADVSVVPLPIVGRDLELVNMWRSQVQLPATSDPDAVKQAEPVAIGTEQGRLFDFVSEQPMIGKSRQRIQVAMLTRGTMSWFFKVTGEDSFVTSQKENFLQFLKSVSFGENSPVQIVAAPATQNENADSVWKVPADWQSVPPSEFLVAKFLIQNGDAKAEVNVSQLAGEGGGLAANVNRWRGQLGLPAADETESSKSISTFDIPNGQATLVDLTGTDSKTRKPARLIGAIVPQNGQTWFYKLMGDEQIVAQQKDAFTKFIQSANYANAH